MNDNESQLRAKDAVENRLNVAEQNVVIALARPAPLQIGYPV